MQVLFPEALSRYEHHYIAIMLDELRDLLAREAAA